MRWVLTIWAAALASGGCVEREGGTCTLDSDCEAGLVCSLEGFCEAFATIAASFDTVADVEVITLVDTSVEVDVDVSGCTPVSGVFDASTAPCATAAEIRRVTLLELPESGHGLAKLAGVANLVIANGFGDGSITLELHIDGDLSAGCPRSLAWVQTPEDIQDDCTPVYSTSMPFVIPALVTTQIDNAVLDPETNILTGLVDKAALLESIAEELRPTADGLITLDVDTDGDGIADRASAIVQITFAQ